MTFRSIVASISLFTMTALSANASAQALDFGKINGIIAGISATLIQDDPFFQELEGKFDGEKTDFSLGNVAGSVAVSVANSKWSTEQSRLQFNLALEKVGEVSRVVPGSDKGKEPITYVEEKVTLGGSLKTQTVELVRYFWQVAGICQYEQGPNTDDYYGYVMSKVCPQLDPVLSELTDISQLIGAVINTLKTAIGSSEEYITIKTAELDQTQDEDQKQYIQYQIDGAKSSLKYLNKVVLMNNGDVLTAMVSLDEVTLFANLSAVNFDLSLEMKFETEKEFFEEMMANIHAVLERLQTEDPEILEDVTQELDGYLNVVRSIAQPE